MFCLLYNYTEIVSGLEESPKTVIRGEFRPVPVYSDFFIIFIDGIVFFM